MMPGHCVSKSSGRELEPKVVDTAHSGPLAAAAETVTAARNPAARYDLTFFNGLGGFTHDGREYLTILGPGQNTPVALVQCDPQTPGVWDRRFRKWNGIHVGGEQPRISPDAMERRSGQRRRE